MADTLRLTAQIWQEDGAYVVHCPELDVTSQGESYEHAMAMIQEACELTVEDMTPQELAERLHPTPTVAPFDITLPGTAA